MRWAIRTIRGLSDTQYIVFLGNLLSLMIASLAFLVHWQKLHDVPGYWLTMLIGVLGIPIGGLLGSVASPRSDDEDARFREYVGLVASFASGYVLSELVKKLESGVTVLFSDPLVATRVLVFSLFFFGAAILFYIYRAYMLEAQRERSSQQRSLNRGV